MRDTREGVTQERGGSREKREVYTIYTRGTVIFVSIPISFSRGFNLADEIGGGGRQGVGSTSLSLALPISVLYSLSLLRHSLLPYRGGRERALAPANFFCACSLNQSIQVSYPPFSPPLSTTRIYIRESSSFLAR